MSSTARDPYMHGSSEEEQSRLVLMNGLLNRACLAELDLRGGERVLEMGAGTGVFAAEMARAIGSQGCLVALERDQRQAVQARRSARDLRDPGASDVLFEVRQGDAYDPPLTADEWGSFDLVHARFLLEHLTEPARAVAHMMRAVRPGGRIVLIDDDHSLMRFDPEVGELGELWLAYCGVYQRHGLDPWIGRKLVRLLVDAGARPLRTAWIPYGGCAGQEIFEPLVENLVQVLGGVRDEILAGGMDAVSFDRGLELLRAWGERPDAALWYGLPCAIAERPSD